MAAKGHSAIEESSARECETEAILRMLFASMIPTVMHGVRKDRPIRDHLNWFPSEWILEQHSRSLHPLEAVAKWQVIRQ